MSWSHPGKAAAGGVAALVAFAAAGGPPAALRFTSAPTQVQAGQCSTPLTVELADDAGVTAIAPADTAVSLTQPDAGVIFSSDICSGILDQVTIDAGTSAVSFAAFGLRAGHFPVIASSPGLASAAQDVLVVAGPPVNAQFVTPPLSVDPDACSPELVVELEDQYGNPSPGPAPISLAISTPPSTTAKAYSDPACQTEIQALVFPAGSSLATLHFKDPFPGGFNLLLRGGSISGQGYGIVRPASLPLQLELAGEEVFRGAELKLRATISYPGPGAAQYVTLRLEVEGASREQPINEFSPLTIGSGSSAQLEEPLIVTAGPGEDVVVRGRTVLLAGNTQIGPEVTVTRTAGHMSADLGGGCGCASAGGANLAIAAVGLALLRGRRRRSPRSR